MSYNKYKISTNFYEISRYLGAGCVVLNALTHPSFVAKLVDKVISPSSRIAVPYVPIVWDLSESLSQMSWGSLVFGDLIQ